MTKEVEITIEGLHLSAEEDSMITTNIGSYHYRNEKHYLQYEENLDKESNIIKNTIKISPKQIDMIKKGSNSSHMVFRLKESTSFRYDTPFGSFILEVFTDNLEIREGISEIHVRLQYGLKVNGSFISNNDIRINITALND